MKVLSEFFRVKTLHSVTKNTISAFPCHPYILGIQLCHILQFYFIETLYIERNLQQNQQQE